MQKKSRKIAIVGVGHVGSHCGLALLREQLSDELILVDIDREKAESQAEDLRDTLPHLPRSALIQTGEYQDCAEADIIVLSAGVQPRKGMTRPEMLWETLPIMDTIVEPVVSSGFSGIFIVISNPVDIISHYVWQKSGFSANRVIGTGTALDSARLRRILGSALNIAPANINAFCMGEHGDSQMIPWSHVTVGDVPLKQYLASLSGENTQPDLDAIAQQTSRAGYGIVNGKGATEFGIAAALCKIVNAVFQDSDSVLPVSALLRGEYGQDAVYAGVPAVIGQDGVKAVLELDLPPEEREKFADSCSRIRSLLSELPDVQRRT